MNTTDGQPDLGLNVGGWVGPFGLGWLGSFAYAVYRARAGIVEQLCVGGVTFTHPVKRKDGTMLVRRPKLLPV